MAETLNLFPADIAPPGFRYLPDIVTPDEEAALIAQISGLELQPFDFRGFQGHRRTIAFGSRYDFTHQRLRCEADLPDWLTPLRDRAADFAGVRTTQLERALVIEYPPGAGIGWHRDRPQYDQVIGVSLSSLASLRLRRARTDGTWQRRAAPLQPRSAYVLRDEVRNDWEHSIVPGESVRYSVTFRTLR